MNIFIWFYYKKCFHTVVVRCDRVLCKLNNKMFETCLCLLPLLNIIIRLGLFKYGIFSLLYLHLEGKVCIRLSNSYFIFWKEKIYFENITCFLILLCRMNFEYISPWNNLVGSFNQNREICTSETGGAFDPFDLYIYTPADGNANNRIFSDM